MIAETATLRSIGSRWWFAVGYCLKCKHWMEREGDGPLPAQAPWHRVHKNHDVRVFAERVLVSEGTSEERAGESYSRARTNQRRKLSGWMEKHGYAKGKDLPQAGRQESS